MHVYMHNMHSREERLHFLQEVVATRSLKRQDQIVRLLRQKGFDVTQASVSRDLEILGISKENGVYRRPPRVSRQTPFGLVSFQPSGDNLIVAKCGSGLASALAVRIDAVPQDGIVGTIAGDDTVFIAITSQKIQKGLIKKLKEDLG